MARTRVVTRTINEITVKAMCVDVPTSTIINKDLILTGELLTDDKALKVLKKTYETDTLKVVSIISKEVSEKIYGMLETEFIKLAKPMDELRHFCEDVEVTEEAPVEEAPVEEAPTETTSNGKGKRK